MVASTRLQDPIQGQNLLLVVMLFSVLSVTFPIFFTYDITTLTVLKSIAPSLSPFLIEHSKFCICLLFLSDQIEIMDSWPNEDDVVCFTSLIVSYLKIPIIHKSLINEVSFHHLVKVVLISVLYNFFLFSFLIAYKQSEGWCFKTANFPLPIKIPSQILMSVDDSCLIQS